MSRSGMGKSLGALFSESFRLLLEKPLIVVPSLLPFLWLLVISIIGPGVILTLFYTKTSFYGATYVTPSFIGVLAGYALFTLIFFALYMIAEGMTVVLVRQAYDESRTDLGEALSVTMGRIGHLLLATLVVVVLVTIGELLLVIPGLIMMFLFWFVPQAVMLDDGGGLSAIGQSYRFFRENVGDAFVLILVSIVLYSLLGLLSWIPVIGAILMLAGMPILSTWGTLLYLER